MTTTTVKTTVSTPKVTPSAAAAFEKPTIFDIISETEKNHTLMRQMNRISSTASTPIALPLSASSPSMNQQPVSDTPKAINHMGVIHHNGHPGVAEPLTWQQVESELIVDQNHKETSTSKDGISTWILLSGSDNKPQTPATPVTTASVVGHVDKIHVKDVLNERHNYRFQQMHPEKVSKPIKNRDQPEKRPKPNKKDKVTIESPTTLKTTPMPSSTLSGILVASDFVTDSKHRRKVTPLPVFNKLNKKKGTTTRTTTTTTEPSEELTERLEEEHTISDKINMSDEYPVDTTTSTSFIVLEPKDANFDMPEDRAPKKPKKTMKKGVKPPRKKTGVAKNPNKGPKPLTSTIYSYLSREVMPTVGVGLMGLVLTAGIAGYFFGPLGALRRSYDEATDRQDNVDNIYSVNNEEYASEGNNDHGQNEEEVFSKFLAGMPANYVSRYVKYYRPDGNANGNPHPNQYNYRRVSQPMSQAQAQASNMVAKYTPYMRYRTAPSPHYTPAQYNPQSQQQQQQYAAYLRNHHMNNMNPQSAANLPAVAHQQQQTMVSPVYNPQYEEMQKQKSFATNMENVLKHQTATIYGKKNEYTIVNPSVVQEKSVGAEIAAEPEQPTQQLSDGTNEDQNTEVIESKITDGNDDDDDDMAASQRIQRRTYVVGSSITDNQPAEAIVSASMTASFDGMPGAQKETNEPVFTVTATSHGPRRRRRRDTKSSTDVDQTTENEMKTTTKQSQPSTTTEIPITTIEPYTTRLYGAMEYANLENDFNMLHEKLMSFDRDYSSADNEKKVEKKIQTEFKSIKSDYDALKKAIDGAKAIEQFQKQIRIRPKNFELSVVLKTGITGIRQRIRYLNDLVEHPEDDRMIEKINRRDGSETPIESTTTIGNSSTGDASELPEAENGFVGFLKILQLKAQFGLNLLQNIRPSFERAFEDVFKRPYVNRM